MGIYKREIYLKKIRGFYKSDLIKVITGIRRSGKSCFLESIKEELIESGVNKKDIISINLDKRGFKSIKTPAQLEKAIDSLVKDKDYKYLFIDEIQNVKGYEEVVEAYREEGNFSIFITGSNSYLLSGELMTKLTGRYIEIEMLPLNFYEYLDMKKFLNKTINSNLYIEFDNYIREGGFPKALEFDNNEDKLTYVRNVVSQIFDKDIHKNNKIRDNELFDEIQKFVVDNYGSKISTVSIQKELRKNKIAVTRRTISRYIDMMTKAKILYQCEPFDIRTKRTIFQGEKKYYLSDLSIFFALSTDSRINYSSSIENIVFTYLKSKGYELSIGSIGTLEIDFIARKSFQDYFYIQVSRSLTDPETADREYRPFYKIKDVHPCYIFTMDPLPGGKDGIKEINIIDFMSKNMDL